MESLITETLEQIMSLALRIDLETELCSFIDLSGHVQKLAISIRGGKDIYEDKVHKAEIRYRPWDYENLEEFKTKFMAQSEVIIGDLQNILSDKWDYKYTAYCNLIEMSCSEVFSTEEGANKWIRKMKRKYSSVSPILGVKKEARKI
jgi:hypothetical protein